MPATGYAVLLLVTSVVLGIAAVVRILRTRTRGPLHAPVPVALPWAQES